MSYCACQTTVDSSTKFPHIFCVLTYDPLPSLQHVTFSALNLVVQTFYYRNVAPRYIAYTKRAQFVWPNIGVEHRRVHLSTSVDKMAQHLRVEPCRTRWVYTYPNARFTRGRCPRGHKMPRHSRRLSRRSTCPPLGHKIRPTAGNRQSPDRGNSDHFPCSRRRTCTMDAGIHWHQMESSTHRRQSPGCS